MATAEKAKESDTLAAPYRNQFDHLWHCGGSFVEFPTLLTILSVNE